MHCEKGHHHSIEIVGIAGSKVHIRFELRTSRDMITLNCEIQRNQAQLIQIALLIGWGYGANE